MSKNSKKDSEEKFQVIKSDNFIIIKEGEIKYLEIKDIFPYIIWCSGTLILKNTLKESPKKSFDIELKAANAKFIIDDESSLYGIKVITNCSGVDDLEINIHGYQFFIKDNEEIDLQHLWLLDKETIDSLYENINNNNNLPLNLKIAYSNNALIIKKLFSKTIDSEKFRNIDSQKYKINDGRKQSMFQFPGDVDNDGNDKSKEHVIGGIKEIDD